MTKKTYLKTCKLTDAFYNGCLISSQFSMVVAIESVCVDVSVDASVDVNVVVADVNACVVVYAGIDVASICLKLCELNVS